MCDSLVNNLLTRDLYDHGTAAFRRPLQGGGGGGWGNMRDPVNEVVLDEDNIEKNAGLG